MLKLCFILYGWTSLPYFEVCGFLEGGGGRELFKTLCIFQCFHYKFCCFHYIPSYLSLLIGVLVFDMHSQNALCSCDTNVEVTDSVTVRFSTSFSWNCVHVKKKFLYQDSQSYLHYIFPSFCMTIRFFIFNCFNNTSWRTSTTPLFDN